MTQILVDDLRRIADPYKSCPWFVDELRLEDVQELIRLGIFQSVPHHYSWTPEDHVARIAFLVHSGWLDQIDIDVGVPGFSTPHWPIIDGNHRFAAAIYRGDKYIDAGLSGSCDLLCETFNLTMEQITEEES